MAGIVIPSLFKTAVAVRTRLLGAETLENIGRVVLFEVMSVSSAFQSNAAADVSRRPRLIRRSPAS